MKKRSFTFIELLIGIAIFSIISLATYNILSMGLRVAGIAKRHPQLILQANKVLENLDRDLRNCIKVQLSGDNITGFYGAKEELFFFSLRPAPWPESLIRKELVKVGYIFNKDEVSEEGYLYQGILKGSEIFNPEADIRGEKIGLPLEEVKFEYLLNFEDGEPQFQEEWKPEDGYSELPLAVKVELVVIVEKKVVDKEEQIRTQTFTKTIFLPMAKAEEAEAPPS